MNRRTFLRRLAGAAAAAAYAPTAIAAAVLEAPAPTVEIPRGFHSSTVIADDFIDLEAWIRADLAESIGLELDRTLLEGTGALELEPRGLFIQLETRHHLTELNA